MKGKIFLPFLILVLLIHSFKTYSEKEKKIFYNGYDWEKWTQDLKLGYILGLHDGLRVGQMAAKLANSKILQKSIGKEIINDFDKWLNSYISPGAQFGLLVNGVDEIYTDDKNKPIPINRVVSLMSKRINDEISSKQLKEEIEKARLAFK
jgi:hypothetical protein